MLRLDIPDFISACFVGFFLKTPLLHSITLGGAHVHAHIARSLFFKALGLLFHFLPGEKIAPGRQVLSKINCHFYFQFTKT